MEKRKYSQRINNNTEQIHYGISITLQSCNFYNNSNNNSKTLKNLVTQKSKVKISHTYSNTQNYRLKINPLSSCPNIIHNLTHIIVTCKKILILSKDANNSSLRRIKMNKQLEFHSRSDKKVIRKINILCKPYKKKFKPILSLRTITEILILQIHKQIKIQMTFVMKSSSSLKYFLPIKHQALFNLTTNHNIYLRLH